MPHQTEITSLNSPGQLVERHIGTKQDSLFVKLALWPSNTDGWNIWGSSCWIV